MPENIFSKEFLAKFQEQITNSVAIAINQAIEKATASQTIDQEIEYLSRKEAAAFLKISLPTLDSHVKKGLIPSYKRLGNIRFIKRELEKSFTKRKF